MLGNKRLLAPSARTYLQHYNGQQRGRGVGSFGQIYSGARFPQRGGGIGSFLSGIVRGISSLISRTPSWVKTGAKIVGKSALKNFADYGGDVQAGADPKETRKRYLKSTGADILEGVTKTLRGEGLRRSKRRKITKKKKKKCCNRVKRSFIGTGKRKKRRVTKQRRRRKPTTRRVKRKKRSTIKRRNKFDLLSV
jgi:hypothetical protein